MRERFPRLEHRGKRSSRSSGEYEDVAAKVEKGQVFRAVDPPHFEWRVEEVYPTDSGPANCKIVRTDDRHAVKTMSVAALADDALFTPKSADAD